MRTPDQMYASPSDAILSSESSRSFMQKVYAWMTGGLALTGVTAMVVASQPAIMNAVSRMVMPLLIGQIVLVMAFSFLANRVSTPIAGLMFLAYSFTTGLVFSTLFFVYTSGSIASVFFVTAGAFAALSVFGLVTKKDLSAWKTFLFIGLIGLVIAGVVNIFLHSAMVSFVASCAGVLVFAGLTAYDTQKLKTMHATAGYKSSGALAINGALMLYLDFINLFLFVLRLFGRRR